MYSIQCPVYTSFAYADDVEFLGDNKMEMCINTKILIETSEEIATDVNIRAD